MDSTNISLPARKSFQVFLTVSYYFISLVLIVSGISKIIDPAGILNVLKSTFNFLNENIIILIASIVPLFEIASGTFLLLKIKVKESLVTAASLFGVFTLFAAYGFAMGIEDDCGCFGNFVSSVFDSGMIIRNILLLVITAIYLKYFDRY